MNHLTKLLNKLAGAPGLQGMVQNVQAARTKLAFDFTREMFTIAKYNDGLYRTAAQGKTALDYALRENQHPEASEAWARSVKGYDRQQMRHIAVVNKGYGKVYYFLLDRAGIVAWTSSKLRKDGRLPKPRRLLFERPELNAQPIASDDAPVLGNVIEGVYDVEGKVYSTKSNRNGPAMLVEVVKDGVQFRLFGNLGAELIERHGKAPSRGTKVHFKAEVSRSRNDPQFGFFSVIEADAEEKGKVPEGKHDVKAGEILSVYWYDSPMYGTSLKMRVRALDINKKPYEVEGTVPAKMYRRVEDEEELVGQSVTFSATFKPSRNDPSFGFFSRPSNVTFDSLSMMIEDDRSELSDDVRAAVSWLVVENPMEHYMVGDFEDGEVEIERNPGTVNVTWSKMDVEASKRTVLMKDTTEDKVLYDYAHQLYADKAIYKKDLDAILNFEALYRSGGRRYEFTDRNGQKHSINMMVKTYPSYRLLLRYDDENEPRVYEVTNL